MLTIYNPIGTSIVCGFQLNNKKSLYYTYFEIPLVDHLILTTVFIIV
jgi:hypothetical protein